MLPQSEFESPMFANAPAPVAIAAITQDRALIGLLRSVVDPSTDVILVTSEGELLPHLNGRRVSVALLDSMFIEGDLAALAERLRETWPDLVLVVVGTAEEQSKVASQITSGVVYRFLHRPVSAPRVRLFVEAALRRHEVENVERTLETVSPDFSRLESTATESAPGGGRFPIRIAAAGLVLAGLVVGGVYLFSGEPSTETPAAAASVVSPQAVDPESLASTSKPVPAPAESVQSQEPAAAPLAADTDASPLSESVPAPAPEPEPATVAPAAAQDARLTAATDAPTRELRATEAPVEATPPAPPPPAPLTHEQRLREKLAQAEAALQRGDLATPAGRNAVDLFRDALDLDPANTLAKAGLVRVADRLLSTAERALTAGNAENARKMVDVAETLTPATARGAFLTMQIEMERERAALTAKRDNDAQDRLERGATYLRLANTRLRSGALIDPPQDNARFYLEAAGQTIPGDPGLTEATRVLQKELLTRAGAAATAGNAAETERWLAYADGAGASRQDLASLRQLLQETLLGTRAEQVNTLVRSFNAALGDGKLLQPEGSSAKAHLFALIQIDAGNPAVSTARQGLGQAYLRELRASLEQDDIAAADAWLIEAQTISYASAELNAAQRDLAAAREMAEQRARVVGANSLARVEYVAPKFPLSTRARDTSGWVELEFTVRTDGSTADIVITNSSPRRTFDSAAIKAVEQWRYKPVMRDGIPVDQRAAIRIRFSDE